MLGRREKRGVWRQWPARVGERPTRAMMESRRRGSYVRLFRLIPCETIDHTWAFLLHVYLYKNYNFIYKSEIRIIKTLHDSKDRKVMPY
jgi:hypothetical protein